MPFASARRSVDTGAQTGMFPPGSAATAGAGLPGVPQACGAERHGGSRERMGG